MGSDVGSDVGSYEAVASLADVTDAAREILGYRHGLAVGWMSMTTTSYQYRYCKPRNAPEERGGNRRSIAASSRTSNAMIIERDVAIRMRDGVTLYADVFRPADERPVPPIIAWTPYGKHIPFDPRRFLNAGVKAGDTSEYTAFEAPDPVFWVPSGYAVTLLSISGVLGIPKASRIIWPRKRRRISMTPSNGRVRSPGATEKSGYRGSRTSHKCSGGSPSSIRHISPPSTPGRAGPIPIGRPRHTAAFQIRIFGRLLWNRWGAARGQIEDLEAETKEHPLYDDFWRSKAADFSKITTPAFVVASWTDQGLHTRGTFEGFKHIASKQKYLLAHGQKKWAHYYVPKTSGAFAIGQGGGFDFGGGRSAGTTMRLRSLPLIWTGISMESSTKTAGSNFGHG